MNDRDRADIRGGAVGAMVFLVFMAIVMIVIFYGNHLKEETEAECSQYVPDNYTLTSAIKLFPSNPEAQTLCKFETKEGIPYNTCTKRIVLKTLTKSTCP